MVAIVLNDGLSPGVVGKLICRKFFTNFKFSLMYSVLNKTILARNEIYLQK